LGKYANFDSFVQVLVALRGDLCNKLPNYTDKTAKGKTGKVKIKKKKAKV